MKNPLVQTLAALTIFGLMSAYGCSSDKAADAKPESKPVADATKPATPDATKPTETAGSPSASMGANATPDPKKVAELTKATESDAFKSLKHEAYEYYGLANLKPVNVTIQDSATKEIRTGTRTLELVDVKDGKATYVQKQSGALQDNGDVTLSLEPDGIYAMSSTVGKMKAHSLEMPAKLKLGGGWTDRTEMDRDQGAIKLDNQLKIERIEKVTVPTGTYDALYVTSTGQGMLGTSKAKLETKSWYVKGRGAVKQEITVTMAGQPKRTLIVQEAK